MTEPTTHSKLISTEIEFDKLPPFYLANRLVDWHDHIIAGNSSTTTL